MPPSLCWAVTSGPLSASISAQVNPSLCTFNSFDFRSSKSTLLSSNTTSKVCPLVQPEILVSASYLQRFSWDPLTSDGNTEVRGLSYFLGFELRVGLTSSWNGQRLGGGSRFPQRGSCYLCAMSHPSQRKSLLYFTCHMLVTPELSSMFFHPTHSARRSESCWVPPCGWTNIAHHVATFCSLLLYRVTAPMFQLSVLRVSCAAYFLK